MGLDVGDARIGVALSDPTRLLASEAGIVYRKEGQPARRIAEMARDAEVDAVVVGFPKNMDGSVGPQARKVQSFAGQLEEHLKEVAPAVQIIFWDERLSTTQALNMRIEGGAGKKERRKPIDALAAVVVLQNYLDYLRRK